ncbi:MAG TPA: AbrB family transcriptional regulator [Lachnospiraceae bacterium]|nr:AbrB/MazE/SpoVT family DNA-binding domain-containing protein [uncultured Lachnoclostridium sp.]HAU84330.1 AbrB family transcriptional regulator [Lachnospiraceae bacterium]
MTRGIIRNLDQLGRVTFPKEARKMLRMEEGTPVEIYVENGGFCVKPVKNYCACCGEAEDKKELVELNGMLLCKECIKDFSKKIG